MSVQDKTRHSYPGQKTQGPASDPGSQQGDVEAIASAMTHTVHAYLHAGVHGRTLRHPRIYPAWHLWPSALFSGHPSASFCTGRRTRNFPNSPRSTQRAQHFKPASEGKRTRASPSTSRLPTTPLVKRCRRTGRDPSAVAKLCPREPPN